LDGGDIRVHSHLATKCIDFPDDLTFGLATDGRIAAHLGNRIDVAGEKQGGGAHSRGGQRCLNASVSGAAYDHIEY
jgi:hypothetical protein